MINKTLAILAGGKSSRMNYKNKALLELNEETFIEHIIKSAEDYEEILIVANKKEDYEKFCIPVISDIYPNQGPMSGIHSALINSKNDKVLCIACDMPFTDKEVLNYLGEYIGEYDILIPKLKGNLEPLCGIYSKFLINKIEERLRNNKNKLNSLILESDYKCIEGMNNREFNESDFTNINTPEDFNNIKNLE